MVPLGSPEGAAEISGELPRTTAGAEARVPAPRAVAVARPGPVELLPVRVAGRLASPPVRGQGAAATGVSPP